jgi:hypothetical protein
MIASDGVGGAIAAWEDLRNGRDIYAQRIDSSGAARWDGDGVAICTAAGGQGFLDVVEDGQGGIIITWQDYRSGWGIYAQRVDWDGNALWTFDGVPICTTSGYAFNPQVATDSLSGAVITWWGYGIWAQRVDSTGNPLWTPGGVAICTATGAQEHPRIVSYGKGENIVTWHDNRSGDYHIYAQRVSSDGSARWNPDGVPVCLKPGDQFYPRIVGDGEGGAIVTFEHISGVSDIYAQRVDSLGNTRWTPDGLPICTAWGEQEPFSVSDVTVNDNAGGAIICWSDFRGDAWDIYAQRVNHDGEILWDTSGVPVCTARYNQDYPWMVADGRGGAVIAWGDDRDEGQDIYAARVDSEGVVRIHEQITATPEPRITLHRSIPNPFTDATTIVYEIPFQAHVTVTIYDVLGREVKQLLAAEQPAGRYSLTWNGINESGSSVSSGAYFLRLSAKDHTVTRKLMVLR